MFLDGPIRSETQANVDKSAQQSGFLAGSHALDSLDKLITSTESYFHPSNYGHWTLAAGPFTVYLVRVWLTIITADEFLATLVCGIHQTLERGAAANLQDSSGKRVFCGYRHLTLSNSLDSSFDTCDTKSVRHNVAYAGTFGNVLEGPHLLAIRPRNTSSDGDDRT